MRLLWKRITVQKKGCTKHRQGKDIRMLISYNFFNEQINSTNKGSQWWAQLIQNILKNKIGYESIHKSEIKFIFVGNF